MRISDLKCIINTAPVPVYTNHNLLARFQRTRAICTLVFDRLLYPDYSG